MGIVASSFYGLLADGSVASWDFLAFESEAAAATHAASILAKDQDLVAVEVSFLGRRFMVPTASR